LFFFFQLPCLAGVFFCCRNCFPVRDLPRVVKENNLLIFLADGDLGVDLGHDSFDLVLCKSQIGVNLFLVNFISLGKREHRNETEDKQRESVEPSADVGHHPEEDAELDGVDHVFDENQAAEFANVGRHVGRDDFGVFLGLLRADAQIHLQVLSERMTGIAFLDGSQSPLVNSKRKRDRQHSEGDVGDDREHGEDGEGDEEDERGSGDSRRLLDFLPVDQIHDRRVQLGGKIARHVAGLRWDDTLDEKGTPLVDCRQHQEVRRQRREECRQERVSVADSILHSENARVTGLCLIRTRLKNFE
jgi:hypothetical protein